MTEHAAWFLARGSGIVAYVLLTLAMVWGLLISSKALSTLVKPKALMGGHESLSLAALLATLVHVLALVADSTVEFGWAEVLVAGASPWRPLAVAWGVVALYGLLVATASSRLRGHIGPKAWRWLHFATFGTFVTATLHGLQAGSDAGTTVMRVLYVDAALLVGGLTVARAVTAGVSRARSPRGTASPRPAGVPDR